MPRTAKMERVLADAGLPFSYEGGDTVRVHLQDDGAVPAHTMRRMREAGYQVEAVHRAVVGVDVVFGPRGGAGGFL